MAQKYLLDSNIVIHFLRKRPEVVARISEVGWSNCCISEVTAAELYYGAEFSVNRDKETAIVDVLCENIEVIPFKACIKEYCRQKARLKNQGKLIEDLDLFIGATATSLDCILVTENTDHMERLENIRLENWVIRKKNKRNV